MSHFDDQPTHTEPTERPSPDPADSGTGEPLRSPGSSPPPPPALAPVPVPLWPPPPPPESEPRPPAPPPAPWPSTADWRQRPNGHARLTTARGRYPLAGSAPLDALGRPLASWFKRGLAIAVDFLVLSFALNEFGHQVFPLVLSSANSKPAATPGLGVLRCLGARVGRLPHAALLLPARPDDRNDALRHRGERRCRRRSGGRGARNSTQRHPRCCFGLPRGPAMAPVGQSAPIASRQGGAHRRGGRQARGSRRATATGRPVNA